MPGVRNQTIPRTRFLFAPLSSLNHLRAPHFASKVSYSASPQLSLPHFPRKIAPQFPRNPYLCVSTPCL